MPALQHLRPRSGSSDMKATVTPAIMKLLIALVVLLAFSFLCVGILLLLRSRRNSQKPLQGEEKLPQRSSSRISHRRHGANTAPIDTYRSEKEMLVEKDESATPDSPVPEIRITFPDEVDEKDGRTSSGRVVKVTMSEKGGVGLEPYQEEQLPPYEPSEGRLQSVDLERIGGLKEKEAKA
ncbi:uncharacterized protein KY384_003620 [Bacidia gigantensis]|uniref:uncharacterized protein n=1 Tax=Bacidia gigantensis TaxID=2732470 RepID=UPI001D055338|nr:uncharacterized protein KY384_003620 [Bacidia gigantensis]KAG8531984.1 hypothetical protein KY384_003620 [Bacidia gigantensis]